MKTILLFLILCVFLPQPGRGQAGRTHKKERMDSTLAQTVLLTSSPKRDRVKLSLPDSLASVKPSLQALPVYSEKQWRRLADSLSALPLGEGLRHTGRAIPKKEVSGEEFLQQLNQTFFSIPDQPMRRPLAPKATMGKAGESVRGPVSVPTQLPQTNLSQLTLPSASLQKLTPLSGSLLKANQLLPLDSLQKVNLKQARLRLVEKSKLGNGDLLKYGEKPRWLDRAYWEGVIGISRMDFSVVQLSPALGYYVTDYLSLGLGPNLLLLREDKKTRATVGLRTFLKVSFLKRKTYLQIEDILDSYGQVAAESQEIFKRHSLTLGVGYLLALSPSLSLNLSIGYQLKNNRIINNAYAPWVFRTGVSSIQCEGLRD